ncbi:MAG: cytochrome c [Deltaproteobacteria bacterium]|nr:MAG: cytochrome c [Deltaproteobacteria bacterium]
MKQLRRWLEPVLLLAVLFVPMTNAGAQTRTAGAEVMLSALRAEESLKLGKRVYQRHCSGCHGLEGNGEGPAARWLDPKPRDFTLGTFKFRTTPSGFLPTDEDLLRTIREGVHGTSMPSWRLMPEVEQRAVIAYIKTFSDAWEDPANYAKPVLIPYPPEDLKSKARVRLGRTVYRAMGCKQCHGETGGGDGPSSKNMTDDKGNPIRPANFHRGVLRGGRTPRDIYRTIVTGISGTPMPGFTSLTEEQVWGLVAYVREIIKHRGDPDPDAFDPPCTLWNTCPPAEEANAGATGDAEAQPQGDER